MLRVIRRRSATYVVEDGGFREIPSLRDVFHDLEVIRASFSKRTRCERRRFVRESKEAAGEDKHREREREREREGEGGKAKEVKV